MRIFKNYIREVISIIMLISISYTFLLIQSCKTDKKQTKNSIVEVEKENVIEIITENMDFQMVDTLQSGWNTFKYENLSNETHFFLLDIYPEGKTMDTIKKAVLPPFDKGMELITAGKNDEAMAEFGKLPEWFSDVRFVGGSGLIAPKRSTVVSVKLEPGHYIMECYVKMPNGKFHGSMGMIKEFFVLEEDSGQEPPKNDYSVSISSTEGITMNQGFEKGKHVIAVTFKDQIVHEHFLGHDVNLVKLDDNANLDELEAWMNWATPDGLKTPVPSGITFLGGVNNMEAGNTGYFEVDLKPGNYALIAEVPNAKSKKMLKTFEVID